MSRKLEAVQVKKTVSQDEHSHPAFGQMRISRVQGSGQVLYGSDFTHSRYITIEISQSTMNRNLARDWFFQGKEIIEIALSEAQWATFVSSFQVGEGVPCTILSREGKLIPSFPLRDESQEFRKEVADTVTTGIDSLRELKKTLESETSGLSKTKARSIMSHVEKAIMELEHNLPFVSKSFDEHMETRVEKAKVEVHAYMSHAVVAAGLQALREDPVALLEKKQEEKT